MWLRVSLLPWRVPALQRRLDDFAHWFNEYRPHRALGGRAPVEAWEGVQLPEPIPIRTVDQAEIHVQVKRRSCRGDPNLPIISLRITRKEAA